MRRQALALFHTSLNFNCAMRLPQHKEHDKNGSELREKKLCVSWSTNKHIRSFQMRTLFFAVICFCCCLLLLFFFWTAYNRRCLEKRIENAQIFPHFPQSRRFKRWDSQLEKWQRFETERISEKHAFFSLHNSFALVLIH